MRGSSMRAGRVERVHGGIDALFRDRTIENRRRVKVSERGRGRRVGQVVGGHVNGLHGRDRALGRRGDAFLQRAHVGGERRLIAHGGRNTAEKGRHFRARLREAEDVVHEEEHVLALVAEMLGDSETRQRDAGTGSGRLVHLAEHEGTFRTRGIAVVLGGVLVHARLDHLVIEVIAFARALADTGEDRITAMRLRDVVDELLNEHRLADADAAKEADLAAARVRSQQVDDLDAGDAESLLQSTARLNSGASW